ncbi:transglutaminase domain-containing protein [Candidatus Woesearchaeota archaeon]|nr:transglutaminase domain-containing protein [Candidatus Woesearchaeota archaeon]
MAYEWDDNSWWNPWRIIWTGALALCLGFGGGVAYLSHQDSKRKEIMIEHQAQVEKIISPYKELEISESPLMTCVILGSEGKIVKNSEVLQGIQSNDQNLTVANSLVYEKIPRDDDRPFIRPVDGGQNISLESKIKITGIEYGSVEGWIHDQVGLQIIPEIPDIFPHQFRINGLKINETEIPLKYVENRKPSSKLREAHHYLDLRRLVEDEILSETDFEGDRLEIILNSEMEIEEIGAVYEDKVAEISAYENRAPRLKRYTQKTKQFPSEHYEIKQIVAGYTGDKNDVWGIIQYSLEYTVDSLEYCNKDEEGNSTNCPGGDYLPVMDLIDRKAGVCVGYSELFITILRSFGVPARVAEGSTTKPNGSEFSGRHAWVETYVPFKDGSYRWIHIEPTWADNTPNPEDYINYVDSRYLYHIDLEVKLDTSNHSDKFYIFQEHTWKSQPLNKTNPADIQMPAIEIRVKKEDLD